MSSRSINVADLETTTPNHVLGVTVGFFDSRQKRYVINIHDVEIKTLSSDFTSRAVLFDFACKSSVDIETVSRFNAKRLAEHAGNWKNIAGVKELIAEILKVRKLELTDSAKAILES